MRNAALNAPSSGFLQAAVFENGKQVVKPQDDTAHKIYTFYVRVEAEGGKQLYSQKYTYYHGCPPEIISFSQNPGLIVFQSYKIVENSLINVYTFEKPIIWPDYCLVTSFSVEAEFIEGVPVSGYIMPSASCSNPCNKFTLQFPLMKYMINFRIRTYVDGGFEELSPKIFIGSSCSIKSATITSNVTTQHFLVRQYGKLRIPLRDFRFKCEPEVCCQELQYKP